MIISLGVLGRLSTQTFLETFFANKMNSANAMNILYSYFNIKKNKLTWTGSFETLKALELTEIDEETAEATIWRSPSGGKWLFDSNLLSVTWLVKSQNIYFDGEKGSDLMTRIYLF